MKLLFKSLLVVVLSAILSPLTVLGQNNPSQTELKVNQLIEKRAEYSRLTNGEIDGYRIKIHFGGDREEAKTIETKFSAKFSDYSIDTEYQQPNFVVLIGDFKSKLEAFESLKKIQIEFPNSFIVKGKIRVR
ncbi:SPOR domain-containing protein [Sediminibacterium sp.]|uniref:SPOR domain-containing protein n=1 Tax=Sediminibacterium sp. TaxID=1917865 RepID=UPI00271B1591|nr:SPOR domain-containing protein [Sediminibacterium sp.]MDO9000627.1 SPOR domain-containing protein [Bacteroidota bacterium]MDP3146805.1 SPOR domain-containing protein [Bacteroidota bacterium]MDP3567649.1 SPOR domain-containing protein [Sediminibacterium sp.]